MISVADVIQAVDGPVTVTACSTDDHNCDQYSKCSVRDPLWKIKGPHSRGADDVIDGRAGDRRRGAPHAGA